MTRLECTTRRTDGHAVITVTGDLDLGTRDALIRAVHEALDDGATTVELDLSGLAFCDSSGLTGLVAAHRIAEADGRRAYVGAASPPVRNLLERVHRLSSQDPHPESTA